MRTLTTSPTRRLVAALAFAGLLFAACGGDSSSSAPDTSSDTASDTSTETSAAPSDGGGAAAAGPVTIVEFAFDPVKVSAAPGEDVEFTNEDGTAHTATAADNSFNTGSIQGGESGTAAAPDAPGEYPFFCSFHPFMKGTVVVK